MSVSDAKRLKELESENARLKKMLAESMLEIEVTREALREKVVSALSRRELVRHMTARGLSERRALQVMRMSARGCASALYRHRHYGAAMIYLKLRQAGEVVNHKRVERLYAEARLQVRRRKRKKIPIADRQPLGRPRAANQVWSMDFVFDRTTEGRVMNILTMVDDATHEAVAIVPERTIGGLSLTRILDASGHVTRSAQSHPHG